MAFRASQPGLRTFLSLCLVLLSSGCASTSIGPPGTARQECVVLLHGLARTSLSMGKLEEALLQNGYAVCNVDYPSRKKALEELADTVIGESMASCRDLGAETIHYVTHSMGGIVLRLYLEEHQPKDLGRVVMLSPPNQGTEIVDVLGHNPLFSLLYGPAANQLGTDERGLPRTLGSVNFELGIITGRRSVNPLLSLLIKGEDDGKVSVTSAAVKGMKELVTVDVSHPFIMRNDRVIELVLRFLGTGSFSTGEAAAQP